MEGGEWPEESAHAGATNFSESIRDGTIDPVPIANGDISHENDTAGLDATVTPMQEDQTKTPHVESSLPTAIQIMEQQSNSDINALGDIGGTIHATSHSAQVEPDQGSSIDSFANLGMDTPSKPTETSSAAALEELDSWAAPVHDTSSVEPNLEPESVFGATAESHPISSGDSVDNEEVVESSQHISKEDSSLHHQYTSSFARTAESVQVGESALEDPIKVSQLNEAPAFETSFSNKLGSARDEFDDWTAAMGSTIPQETAREPLDDHPVERETQTSEGITRPDPFGATPDDDLAWMGGDEPGEELEDSWARALGSADESIDTSWDAAFAEGFDDGGFLEDEPVPTAQDEPANVVATKVQPAAGQTLSQPYNAVSPIRALPTGQQNAGPMKFFEDLPTTQPVKARRPKQQVVSHTPTPPPAPPGQAAMPARAAQSQTQYGQFRQPERLDPFPPQPTAVPPASIPSSIPPDGKPSTTARYSPAPTQPQVYPKDSPVPPQRYSSVAARQPPPLPAKDTPSTKSQYAARPASRGSSYAQAPPQGTPQAQTAPVVPPQRPTGPEEARTIAADRYSPGQSANVVSPPPVNAFAPRTSSPLARVESYSQHAPSAGFTQAPQPETVRPASLTQRYSPSMASTTQPTAPQTQTASMPPLVHARSEPPPALDAARKQVASPSASKSNLNRAVSATMSTSNSYIQTLVHQAPQVDDSHFVLPDDETARDPLQRWKGRPIFHWGPSGMLSTSFPKQIPRYGGGQTAPMMKCLAGEVHIRRVKDILPEPTTASFPGPLKSKNKKKDVISWLSSKIDALQHELQNQPIDAPNDSWSQTRLEEKIILWELMRLLVEHDGLLAGNTPVESAVRWILSPNLEAIGMQQTDPFLTETAQMAQASILPNLRQSLLRGERENAIWHAVDNRMWAHALLISSTLGGNIWKQVVQEFVRKEVRAPGQENRSLAALYSIFGGNWDESIDELVPVAARAGLQMVSTTESPGRENHLEGLNKWRETLGLILSNRSTGDESALLALGRLLAGYGRVEAAHVCFLFCRSLCQFGGADDSNSNFTLLGADVRTQQEASHDLDAILLTEVYEFALSLPPTSTNYYIPHLQAYKLYHAYNLAEIGQRAEALQYCDAIASAMKATTRSSPYYHPVLASYLDDLAKRLSQSPKDGTSGWMSKPSIEKVSGSMWARFNSFVAGDETDSASNASGGEGQNEIGPFAHFAGGEVQTISRTGSSADIYGSVDMSRTETNSRYAPASQSSSWSHQPRNQYTPSHGSPYQPSPEMGPTGLGSKRSMDSIGSGSPAPASPFVPKSSGLSQSHTYTPQEPANSSRYQASSSYEPYVPSVPENQAMPLSEPSIPPDESYLAGPSYGMTSNEGNDTAETNVPGYHSYASSNGGYGQPTSSSYEPPTNSYQPYQPDFESGEEQPAREDDDENDEMATRAAEVKAKDKAQRDRDADDAVKRAAEADAARDREANEKKGSWFGGWFGKKDPNAPTVHRAKLGEESSFYFDKETNKWVNKKAGSTPPPVSAAAPPPPKAPAARNVSNASLASAGPPPARPSLGPPSGPPSRTMTPASTDTGTGGAPPPSLAAIASGSGPPTAPPSRPTTAMSEASSIDDLIGVPAARKGGTIKKGKKGQRYVDVMAK